jgi:hypothetical protein
MAAMSFNLRGWIKNQWDSTKGNLWWALGYYLFTAFGGGSLFTAALKGLFRIAHIPPANSMGLFVVGSLVSLTIAICFVAARRSSRSAIAANQPEEHAALTEDVTEQTRQIKEVDIFTELLQLHFYQSKVDPYIYTILMKLKLTNRGTAEATIGSWMLFLSIGKDSMQCDALGVLADNLAVKRTVIKDWATLGQEDFEQVEPNLGELLDRNPLKRGIPQVGWVCFHVGAYPGYDPAVNAQMTVYMMDSLGGHHSFVREAQNHKKDGEIVEHVKPGFALTQVLKPPQLGGD